MFIAAGGASGVSLTEKETSSPSLNERRGAVIKALQDVFNMPSWPKVNEVHISILQAAEGLFVHGQEIQDEELLRKVLLLVLFSLNPKDYAINDASVMKRKNATLIRALIAELKRRKMRDLAEKLSRITGMTPGLLKTAR